MEYGSGILVWFICGFTTWDVQYRKWKSIAGLDTGSALAR